MKKDFNIENLLSCDKDISVQIKYSTIQATQPEKG